MLDGISEIRPPTSGEVLEATAVDPPGAYVTSITVEGFRGVGPATTLNLRTGPGLTLVVGRNGSGKSSFAEGLEYLLTGCNYRWEGRAKAWVTGWHNLHHERVALSAELLVEGQGPLTVSRTWKTQELSDHDVKCAGANPPQSLKSLGWDDALETFRPFLSYNELGSLLEDGPSTLYDALSNVLGLEELVAVQERLATTRKGRQTIWDEAQAGAAQLKATIDRVLSAGTSDERVDAARRALTPASWDLAALATLVEDNQTSEASPAEMLRRIEGLPQVDTEGLTKAIGSLRSTANTVSGFAGSNAERSRHRASLLEQALEFHRTHHDDRCPVCGTSSVLNEQWVIDTSKEIAELRAEAAACSAALNAVQKSVQDAHRQLSAPPTWLATATASELADLPAVVSLWAEWSRGQQIESPLELADHLESRVLELAEAIQRIASQAAAERIRRDDSWRPIAAGIQAWLPKARKAAAAKDQIKQLKAAESWWKDAAASIRDERFEPIADRAGAIWNQLRLQSNVDLGGVVLEGTGQRRRVELKVTVDGTPAEALGVMSQGELHSLALSLFLPRATLPESPFRFICVDDPVQSMDPSRVDGLARVLSEAAVSRQVIVFTHDERLPEAVRRMGLKAIVHRVTRRARSIVEVEQTSDPVSTLIDDARAVALTDDLPAEVASRVVPGFCRSAVEAACMDAVRRRRLARGEPHDAVEELLLDNARTHQLMTLALFDDAQRDGDVMGRLNKLGPWAVDAFKACKLGAHQRYEGDLGLLIDNSGRLARQVLQLQ